MPSKEITDDLDLLLRVMPPHIRDALHRQPDLKNLIEVVMDLGRPPEGRFPSRAVGLSELSITREDIDWAVDSELVERWQAGDERAGDSEKRCPRRRGHRAHHHLAGLKAFAVFRAGNEAGDAAPRFDLPAVNREGRVSLDDYVGRTAVLVGLFRGLHCPFCRRQVALFGRMWGRRMFFGKETNGDVERNRGIYRHLFSPAVVFGRTLIVVMRKRDERRQGRAAA